MEKKFVLVDTANKVTKAPGTLIAMTMQEVADKANNEADNGPRGDDYRGIPFKCIVCNGAPTHLAYTPATHWVWVCSNDDHLPLGYNIELTRLQNHTDALGWLMHLGTTKVWFPETTHSWVLRMHQHFGWVPVP